MGISELAGRAHRIVGCTLTLAVASCGRTRSDQTADASVSAAPDLSAACRLLAAKVRDTYGTVRNHYDAERWDSVVSLFTGARAESLREIGLSLAAAERPEVGILRANGEPYNQLQATASSSEREQRRRSVDALVREARERAKVSLKSTDARLQQFVSDLERSSDPSCVPPVQP